MPGDALFMAFHTPGRQDGAYYASDLLSDLLGNGRSSRLYRHLVKERELFTMIDAYVTATIDPGLLIIEGRPAEGISLEQAREAIWGQLELLKAEGMTETEMTMLRNKAESTLIFSEMSILSKASNLAFFELLGKPELINEEPALYNSVTAASLQQLSQSWLRQENCVELAYKAVS